MEIVVNPGKDQWESLCRRNIPADDLSVDRSVREIIEDVAVRGDKALKEYASRFDGCELDSIVMEADEIDRLAAKVSPEVADAIRKAADNIAAFHKEQLMQPIEVETTPGVRCIQRQVPIQNIGLYIPGGRAPLFSTVLMLGIPAKIAGCPHVALCTPRSSESGIAPEIIFAAKLCGIETIYQIGGAQAIAAMAYGTESVHKVDKIFGPGNRYVTKAKQMVTNVVAIDMPAGPSEVMVMADSSANAEYIAADLLSQAEHGPDSQSMLITDSFKIADDVEKAVNRQTKKLTRTAWIERSMAESRILIFHDRETMVDFANTYASEHLIVAMNNPWEIANAITSAGSVFIGNYSCESAGDYASGTNHTLPTSAWARAYSGVNIDSFMKKITYQELTREGLDALASTIITMAEAEGLDAHAAAVKVRMI